MSYKIIKKALFKVLFLEKVVILLIEINHKLAKINKDSYANILIIDR